MREDITHAFTKLSKFRGGPDLAFVPTYYALAAMTPPFIYIESICMTPNARLWKIANQRCHFSRRKDTNERPEGLLVPMNLKTRAYGM